jgi:hypothetical protein
MNRYTSSKHFVTTFILLFFLLSENIYAQDAVKNKLSVLNNYQTGSFPLAGNGKASTIYYSVYEQQVVKIAAKALQQDIKLVNGATPALDSSGELQPYCIIIGTIGKNKLIDQLISDKKLNVARIRGQWETFGISVIDQPFNKVKQALVIAGSDARGTAFGVFELSKMMGVHPFYWWADIKPLHQKQLFVSKGSGIIGPPSVKYRGIFLNDEDWGLQPWAAKTFEPETGDIGPKTYARIFELLLRLKANLIWPAMHPSTKAFYHYPGNPGVAADYAIIVGSSHAEPMLRNNVGEWDEKTMGHFNYVTNKEKVYQYWEERVKQSKGNDAIYTMGMRGVHDSQMEGVKNEKEAVPLLERIIADQRELLKENISKDVTDIPQVFTAYKEVLDIYDAGLKIPEDITLVWPDDNYGYIQRLNNEKEQARAGGSGVYYHASYWGRPHDYLWLSSVHPALMREEMMKAYALGANRLWVLNVGDIKPLEYNIGFFLDMAFDATPFKDSRYVKTYLGEWAASIFGKTSSQKISNVLSQYYQLAFERKPEFMGWSQTEPTTKTNFTKYNHFFFGDEAQQRIEKFQALGDEVKNLRSKMDADRREAFYQLVYYPVMGASWINKKFIYRDKAVLYAKQNRLSAYDYASFSKAAYDSIVKETVYYNKYLAGGKWNNMMSMKPRDLPVYQAPEFPAITINGEDGWSIAPEGHAGKDSSLAKEQEVLKLPAFNDIYKQEYFIDIFLTDKQTVSWTSQVSNNCIKLSHTAGVLSPGPGKNQMRLLASIDWNKVPGINFQGQIIFKGSGKQMIVHVKADKLRGTVLSNFKGFIENNGSVSMHATSISRKSGNALQQWHILRDLGYTGNILQVMLPRDQGKNWYADTLNVNKNAAVEYDFYTFTADPAQITIYTLPTHPVNKYFSMRYGVSVDDGPVKIIDYRTFGRSEEWKQNVLSNRAERKVQIPFLDKGKHKLTIFAIDPGVMLDEIRIDLGGLKKAYSVIPETKMK